MRPTGLALAALAALAALPASSAAQDPPPHDAYLRSLPVTQPGEPLPRDATILDNRWSTANATEQSDIFTPDGPGGGPAEPTNCDGTPYGKTVWYDIYPDRAVIAEITVNGTGFDPVLAILRFDPRTNLPAGGLCINRLASTGEVLQAPLEAGGAYTVQIGGAHFTGGPFDALFDFFPPPTIDASSTLRARPTSRGIRVVALRVEAPRGARVEVRCTRRGCRRQIRTAANAAAADPWGPIAGNASLSSARPRTNAARVLSFRNVRNRSLRAGQAIEIRVTQPGFIGRYVKYTVRRGNFRRTTGCLEPGSRRPRRRCG